MLTEQAARKIAGYMLVEDEECRDAICWRYEPSGIFSISSAYNIIHNLRVFLWIVYHQKIMSNEMRRKEGFTNDDSCHICHHLVEDTNHILRKCSSAEEVWMRVAPNECSKNSWKNPFREWISNNVRRSTRENPEWNVKFAIVLWWLWRWRNDEIFNEVYKTTKQKVHWIEKQTKEIITAFRNATRLGGEAQIGEVRWLKWKKPDKGWHALNTDGCVTRKDMMVKLGVEG